MHPPDPPMPFYESVESLAARTDTHVDYWNRLRSLGGGPPYVKVGRLVRYPCHEVDGWMADRLRERTGGRTGA